jgi:hypothetical protein
VELASLRHKAACSALKSRHQKSGSLIFWADLPEPF